MDKDDRARACYQHACLRPVSNDYTNATRRQRFALAAHKQVVPARFRQAGMRWSEAGARRLLALRLLLLNDN